MNAHMPLSGISSPQEMEWSFGIFCH
ncbi:protein of unknown function [Paraburkholderia kururiensis]